MAQVAPRSAALSEGSTPGLGSVEQEAAGQGDAPWPPMYKKQEGEPSRVQPSKMKGGRAVTGASGGGTRTGRRVSTKPLLEIGRAAKKEDALAGLERWKAKHSDIAALLAVDDILVDSMRGRSSTWTRVRVNLRHIPEAQRPPQATPDPDDDPTRSAPRKRSKRS